jgi:TonB-linked SusC/RagA family outer membrane protein
MMKLTMFLPGLAVVLRQSLQTGMYGLLLFFLLLAGPGVNGQEYPAPLLKNQRMDIAVKNKPLEKVFQEIERHTPYRFVFNNAQVQAAGRVSISGKEIPVEQVLRQVLPPWLVYEQRGNNILILQQPVPLLHNHNPQPPNEITGRVTDPQQLPVAGVTVTVKNKNRLVLTDSSGHFSIRAAATDSLLFSYVGFAPLLVPAGNGQPLSVSLVRQLNTLNEVIVIGYGRESKRNLSTAIASISAGQLTERATSVNIVQAMAGKAPGVSIMINSGKPGGYPSVKIRGTGSINASNAPLYVMDGLVGVDPSIIDPSIIQSVDILKDAAAASIYGSRGSNGVVLITTRQGNRAQPEISFSHSFSMGSLARRIQLADAGQALEMLQRQYAYVPGRLAPHLDAAKDFARKAELFAADGSPRYHTDWQKEATRTAFSTNSSLSFSGGGEHISSLVNVSYKNQQGILLNSYTKQLNLFANLDWAMKPWFSLKTMINAGGIQSGNVDLNPLGFNAIREMYEFLPFLPVRYADGSYSRKGDYPGAENSENPVRLLNEIKSVTGEIYAMSVVTATVRFSNRLRFISSFGGQLNATYNNYYAGKNLYGVSSIQGGIARRTNNTGGTWTNEDYFSYDIRLPRQTLNLVGGASWYYNVGTSTFAGAEHFFDDFFSYNSLQSGTIPETPASDRQQYQMNSFFTRAQYAYDERFFASASLRSDGSSRFGVNNRYGFFPAVSAGWQLSKERFFRGLLPVISYCKLRASYGITGNAEIGNYSTIARFSSTQVVFNNQLEPAVVLASPGNKALKWERERQWDLGINLGLLHDRVELVGDVYKKVTYDLLYNRQLPATSGYTGVYDNVGSIRNWGLELGLNTRNIVHPRFSWYSTLNFSLNRSKVLHLNGDILYTWAGRIKEGAAIDEFFGYRRLGTWHTQQAAEAAAMGRKPGDIRWDDVNGNRQKDDGDRVMLGYKMPRWETTVINTFRLGRVGIYLDWYGMFGHKLANFPRFIMESENAGTNSFSSILQSWTPEHQQTPLGQLRLAADGGDNEMDSYYIEGGSFVRLRNVALSYDLPPSLLRHTGIQKCLLSVNAENCLLFTRYRGYDPETTSFDGDLNQGVDVYQYPKARTISLNLQLTF